MSNLGATKTSVYERKNSTKYEQKRYAADDSLTKNENIPSSDQFIQELILNQAEVPIATPQTNSHIINFCEEISDSRDNEKEGDTMDFEHGNIDITKMRQRGSDYEFGSFKDFNQDSMSHQPNHFNYMHNVSPKFNADSMVDRPSEAETVKDHE